MKYRHLIILLITLCILVLVTGCNKQHTDNTEGDSSLTSSNNETSETFNQSYSLAKYMSFEESLSSATHIVMATFTGKTQIQNGAQDYLFTVETVLKGEFKTADFYVHIKNQIVEITDSDFSYGVTAYNHYVAGKTYLLVLQEVVSVYHPYDWYTPINNIMIADSHASMYDDSPLSLHSSNIRGDVSYSEVANYVSQFISEHPYTPSSRGTEYIRSTHLDDIVLGSTHVVKVTPIELLGIGEGNHTERYLCTVDNVLSGSVTTKNLSIIFIEDTVEPGNQYIVMLNWKGSAYCSLSSKNSVYPANDDIVKQIEDILNSKR